MATKNNSRPNNCIETDKLMSCLQIGKLLTSTLKLNEILELILLKASQHIKAQNWSLLLADEATGELRFEVAVGIDKNLVNDIRIKSGQGVAGRVFQSGESLFLSDTEDGALIDRTVDKLCGFTTRSVIGIPLQIHGKTLGVIEIINVGDLEEFKTSELPIVLLLADYAAIAIENSMYVSKIHQMSITDEYTGLRNARYLHEKLPGLIQKASKEKYSLAVIFMDIDNFKGVVDTYGHLQGSLVLKEVGQTIAAHISDKDLIFKYGGDEYVMVYQEKNRAKAIEQTEKIRKAILSSTYLQNEKKPIKITASFGIAIYPEDGQTKKELLIKADDFMYQIKNTTKNGVASA